MGKRSLSALVVALAGGCMSEGPLDEGTLEQALGVDVVVDDGSAGWSVSGGWTTSANAGYYGTSSHVIAVGDGTAVAQWNATLPRTGTYRVYAWWVASSNRAPNATYTVQHAGGSSNVALDQRANGSRWNVVGTYAFNAGAAQVTLNNSGSSGYVSADAVRFEPLDAVVDNGTAAYSETGTWGSSTSAGFYGTNSRWNDAGSGLDEARWTFSVDRTGNYEVHAWWVASTNRAPDAKYRIEHADGTAVVQVDQRTGGARWNVLGVYRFVAGTTYTLRLRDDVAAGSVISADAIRVAEINVWGVGSIASRPPSTELRPLPGGGNGVPSIVSNNPEVYTGNGLLFGTGTTLRGGQPHPLSGTFSVYVHHINQTGGTRYMQILLTNAGSSSVTVSGYGSGYTSGETGGLPIGGSPDYKVSHDWARNVFATNVASTTIPVNQTVRLWLKTVGNTHEVDGRFAVTASGPVYVDVVTTQTSTLSAGVSARSTAAAGHIAAPSTSPFAFGREAGIYDGDTWETDVSLDVPPAGHRIGWYVNTATGNNLPQVQAFPALMRFTDSCAEAVGMYGNFYDVTLQLRHDGSDNTTRTVAVALASYGGGTPSRFWDGSAWVDGTTTHALNTPTALIDTLRTVSVAPGATVTVQLRAMVPGLTSIYQGLWVATQ